jgi:uncharacterized protein
MKLTDETRRGTHVIRAYSDTEIQVGEDIVIRRSCIITADRIHEWSPRSADDIALADLDPLLDMAPEIVLLGTGETQRFPDTAVLGAILARGIGVEVMANGAACRTYNVLVSEDRKVAVALVLDDEER